MLFNLKIFLFVNFINDVHQFQRIFWIRVQDPDRYRRTDAGWRFAERSFHIVYMGPPDLTGLLVGHPASPLAPK